MKNKVLVYSKRHLPILSADETIILSEKITQSIKRLTDCSFMLFKNYTDEEKAILNADIGIKYQAFIDNIVCGSKS